MNQTSCSDFFFCLFCFSKSILKGTLASDVFSQAMPSALWQQQQMNNSNMHRHPAHTLAEEVAGHRNKEFCSRASQLQTHLWQDQRKLPAAVQRAPTLFSGSFFQHHFIFFISASFHFATKYCWASKAGRKATTQAISPTPQLSFATQISPASFLHMIPSVQIPTVPASSQAMTAPECSQIILVSPIIIT